MSSCAALLEQKSYSYGSSLRPQHRAKRKRSTKDSIKVP